MTFDRVHFNRSPYGEGIYVDIHIPKRFSETFYFLFGLFPFQFSLETPWFRMLANKKEIVLR